MCGIAGVFDPGARDDPEPLLRKAVSLLRHRGPDEQGVWVSRDRTLGLGHARLSVIDLSTGRQPLSNEDGTLQLAFNGEIYGYRLEREALLARGHRFATSTDCEVVLHLYEEMGPACVSRLRGMFAFALADARNRRMLLARDRLGKKPLVVSEHEGRFWLCSEILPMVRAFGLPREVDREALDLYLSLGYIPAPRTIFRSIRKIEPGSILILEEGSAPRPRRYWDLAYEPKLKLSMEEASEEVGARLREATALRLEADVPVGLFLSGGLDSSAVALSLQAASSCRTFTVSFGVPEFDESRHARAVAEIAGTRHSEIRAEPASVEELLPALARHYGEPYADSSAVPAWILSEAARREVTVALCGDGGDELFGGYPRHRAVLGLKAVPRALRTAAGALLDLFPQRAAARGAELMVLPDAEAFFELNALFGRKDRQRLLAPPFHQGESPALSWFRGLWEEGRNLEALDRMLRIDTAAYLPYDLLVKMDIASMAHGLEVRAPLLDHELVSFAARLPADLKATALESKRVLKRVLRRRLPKELVRRRKQGFGLPIRLWFKGELSGYLRAGLEGRALASLDVLEPGAVSLLLAEHERGLRNHQHRLWALLFLAVWTEEVLRPL